MQRLCPQLIYDDCIPVLGEYLSGVVGYDFTTIIPKGTDIQCLVFSMRSKNITAKAITSGRYTHKKLHPSQNGLHCPSIFDTKLISRRDYCSLFLRDRIPA